MRQILQIRKLPPRQKKAAVRVMYTMESGTHEDGMMMEEFCSKQRSLQTLRQIILLK